MVLLRPESDAARRQSQQDHETEPTHARRRDRSIPAMAVLTGLSVALVLGETLLLLAIGAGPALALAPQVTALAPFGIFHDERWLLVYAGSWPVVVFGAVGILAARGALTAVMVKLAWPDSAPPLSWRKAFARGWWSTLAAGVLLSLCASLLVAFELAPISDLWLCAVPTAIGVALFMHHGPVEHWWLHHPRLRSLTWLLAGVTVITGMGAAMVAVPRGWTPLVALGAGCANAITWRGMIRALARPRQFRLRLPVAPVGLVAVVVATVVAVTAVASRPSAASHPPQPSGSRSAPATAALTAAEHPHKPVLVVSGYGVRWNGNPLSLGPGFDVREFSYRGTLDGEPLPYDSAATTGSLSDLLEEFRAQVNAFVAKSGRHISIVGESEGALLATIYLLTTPNPPVDEVVLLSPLVRPGRASYPGPREAGQGLAAGWLLRGIAGATNGLTPLHVSPDSPFIRSLGRHSEALRYAFACPVPKVRQFAVIPLADAAGVPPGSLAAVSHETVVALHGTLLANPRVRYDIAQDLRGIQRHHSAGNWAERLVSSASAAWQAPPRPLREAPPTEAGCREAKAALRTWLSGQGVPDPSTAASPRSRSGSR